MGAPSTGTRGGGHVALFNSWGLLLEDPRPHPATACPGPCVSLPGFHLQMGLCLVLPDPVTSSPVPCPAPG